MASKVVRFRNQGGAIVTFTPSTSHENPRWECGGCGDQASWGHTHRGDAQNHAATCAALPD